MWEGQGQKSQVVAEQPARMGWVGPRVDKGRKALAGGLGRREDLLGLGQREDFNAAGTIARRRLARKEEAGASIERLGTRVHRPQLEEGTRMSSKASSISLPVPLAVPLLIALLPTCSSLKWSVAGTLAVAVASVAARTAGKLNQ